jgi:hypothetical protein
MKRDTLIAQLLAMRATIEAILTALTGETLEKWCCDSPRLQKNETYMGSETSCINCGTVIRAPGGPNHEEVRSDGSRQTE